ncbi:MAG: methylenetetrahydrofolate reductase [NAD(P)H] [Nitrospinota bacterium]
MKVADILTENKRVFSFEFFPPKTNQGMEELIKEVKELKHLSPSYVSVTYGAGGGTRDKTIDIVSRMKNSFDLEPMAHLTCVGSSKSYLRQILDQYKEGGIENILALRGDPPQGEEEFKKAEDGFSHAFELVQEIRKNYDFSIGVAGYPEGHQESASLKEDLEFLKLKVDAGADFVVTQIFFDNKDFFDFVVKAREIGITVPIIPGIMPIANFPQIKRITAMCGSKIPEKVLEDLEPIKDQADRVQQYGTEYAFRQCCELLEGGAVGIHFYTLNKSKATKTILKRIVEAFPE